MSNEGLTREMALRIGLAARALPDATPAALMAALAPLTGLPPGGERLRALRPRDLRDAFETATKDNLIAALAILRGEEGAEGDAPPPPPVTPPSGDSRAIRVACASNGGEAVDGHFGSCARFLVYELGPSGVRLVAVREPDGATPEERAALLDDCRVLFVASIGGPAAAKVVNRGIHPVRVAEGGEARAILASLATRFAANPPPWIARAMGGGVAAGEARP